MDDLDVEGDGVKEQRACRVVEGIRERVILSDPRPWSIDPPARRISGDCAMEIVASVLFSELEWVFSRCKRCIM